MLKFTKYLKICFLFTIILIFIIFGGINNFLNKINREIYEKSPSDSYDELLIMDESLNVDSVNAEGVLEPGLQAVGPGVSTVLFPYGDNNAFNGKEIINIMLIGQDRRPYEMECRSDAMVLATLNKKDNTVKLTSFMRDLYVEIPGYKGNRLNASYQYGGIKLLKETVEKNFLIQIDGNIAVDFEGFVAVVDNIGGIDVEINQREARYLNYKNAGTVHMSGKTALIYSRIREIGNSDYERTERQRKVLTAIYDKTMKMNPVKAISMLNNTLPLVTTDLSNMEIIMLVSKIMNMKYTEPETLRIPVEGSYEAIKIRGMDVIKPDLHKNRNVLHDKLYENK